MDKKVALVGILVENQESVEQLNAILHKNAPHIIGRMGLPHKEKNLSLISIAMDAPVEIIEKMSEEIGKLQGISASMVCSNQ